MSISHNGIGDQEQDLGSSPFDGMSSHDVGLSISNNATATHK